MPPIVGDNEDDLTKEVIKIADALDVVVKEEDISVTHRVGKLVPGNVRPRTVLCKFVSRRPKDRLMKRRKMLKDIPQFKGKVFINEDLTSLRAQLLSYVKDLPNVKELAAPTAEFTAT